MCCKREGGAWTGGGGGSGNIRPCANSFTGIDRCGLRKVSEVCLLFGTSASAAQLADIVQRATCFGNTQEKLMVNCAPCLLDRL